MVVPDNAKWMLVIQFCSNGSLGNWMDEIKKGKRQFDEGLALRIAEEIALGMAFLHEREIAHLDLKPDNIFLNSDNHALVGDFGMAAKLQRQKTAMATSVMGTMVTEFTGGTLFYVAPESWEHDVATRRCDVYAFAIILHNIFVTQCEMDTYDSNAILGGAQVHRFADLYRTKLKNGLRPAIPPQSSLRLSPSVYGAITQLMRASWDQNPMNRPTFEDIVKVLRELRKVVPVGNAGSGRPAAAPAAYVPAAAPAKAPDFNLMDVVKKIKEQLGIEASAKLNDALLEAAAQLGIQEEVAGLGAARAQAARIATELGIPL